MKAILLIFLCTHAFAQNPRLVICSGAGTNSAHIESLGRESGFVDLTVGKMSVGEQVFKVYFDSFEEIESVDVAVFGFKKSQSANILFKARNKENTWIGVSAIPRPSGYWIRLTYKVNFKKA